MTVASVCLLAAWASASYAVEEQLFFKSDYQQEVRDEDVLLLQGNVEVHFRDAVVYADEVRLNDKKQEFFGVGNVRLTGSDRDIFADSIWYNYAHDDFDMRNARGSLVVQGVSELVWFNSERLKGNVNNYKMINGRVTTCTPTEHREYHIEARAVKVLPGNKVIMRNGYFFVMNLPVLWFPYYAFSLAETPWKIDVGKNSSDGTYVKTRYNYLAEQLIVGALVMEYYSRRGWIVGADHSYVLPKQGQGNLRFNFLIGTYRQTNGTLEHVLHANTYNVTLNQAILFGSRFTGTIGLTAASSYNVNSGKSADVSGSIGANYNTGNSRSTLSFDGQQSSGVANRSNWSLGLLHTQNLVKGLSSSWNFDYKVNKEGSAKAADEEFQTQLQFRQDRKGWSWNGEIDSHWDPDGFTYIADRSSAYTDKLPEIDITLQPNAFPGKYRNWLGFQMQALNLVGALLYIGPERTEKNGFYGRFDTRFTRTDKLGPKSNIQSNFDYWQAISSTGDAKYVYGFTSNWNWDLNTRLKSQLGWTRTDEEGRIPLSGYDRPSGASNRLSYSLSYQVGRLYTARMTTSYALEEKNQTAKGHILAIKRLADLYFTLNYTPSTSTNVALSTRYNLAKGDLADIGGSVSMTDDRSYKVNTNFNLHRWAFTDLSATSTFIIGPTWDFTVDAELAHRGSETIIRDIYITHRLDCTYVAFEYLSLNNEWAVTWGVSAFPTLHLGYSNTQPVFGPNVFNSFSFGGQGVGGY